MIINIHLNPPLSQEERFDTLITPSGTVATLLNIEEELGYNEIVGIDEGFLGERKIKQEIEKIIKKDLKNNKTPILLFALLLYNSKRTIKYISTLKKRYGHKIKIIVGGQLVPLASKAYVNNKYIDSVCVGDAEIILPKLLKDFEQKKLKKEYRGWVKGSKRKKFSGVSFEHFWKIKERLIEQKRIAQFSQLTIQGPGGPGCAWAIANINGACSFCSLQNIDVKNQMTISEYLKNEKRLENQFHPGRFFDVANQFLPTINRVEKINWLKKYISIRKQLKIVAKKYAYLTVSSIDDETARLLKEAGVSEIYLGIDHFNEKALEEENKAFRKRKTLEKSLNALKKYKIKFRAGVVLGSAMETKETINSVREGINWMVHNYKTIISAVGIFPVEILPGSKDFTRMRQANLCPDLFSKFEKLGYLSRVEQRRMTREWIKYHSEISLDEIRKFEVEMFRFLKRNKVFGYTIDKKPV